MIYLLIFFCIAFSIIDSLRDVMVKKMLKVNHTINAINYSLLIGIVVLLAKYNIKIYGPDELIQLAFVMCTFRWILFDGFYNIFTGNRWSYIGTTAITDAIKQPWRIIAKCLCGFFSVLFLMQWLLR